MAPDLPKLVTSEAEVTEIAKALADAGLFAVDLEFASEGRYVPELCLVQVAWRTGEGQGLALLDAQAVRLDPIFELIADDATEVVAHAARQDLALLSTRFDVQVKRFWDTQIGAAFLGVGEQVGYGRLIGDLLDISLDKGPQFTDWTKRPLSDRQLRYAAADVTHLLAVWPVMAEKLGERGRLDWLAEESAAMAADVAVRVPPAERYRSLGGWGSLRGKSAAAVVELAAWREQEALDSNKPPSWILPDNALIDLCRRLARNEAALRKAKGVGPGTLKRYGSAILAAIEKGSHNKPPPPARRGSSLPTIKQPLAALLNVLITSRCATETLPPKLISSKSECEDVITWLDGDRKEPLPRMLKGWRREFVGDAAMSLLRGEASLTVEGDTLIVS